MAAWLPVVLEVLIELLKDVVIQGIIKFIFWVFEKLPWLKALIEFFSGEQLTLPDGGGETAALPASPVNDAATSIGDAFRFIFSGCQELLQTAGKWLVNLFSPDSIEGIFAPELWYTVLGIVFVITIGKLMYSLKGG